MKKICVILLLCSSGWFAGASEIPTRFVGSWLLVAHLQGEERLAVEPGKRYIWTINADGTMSKRKKKSDEPSPYAGKIRISDIGQMTATSKAGKEVTLGRLARDGSELQFIAVSKDFYMVYELMK